MGDGRRGAARSRPRWTSQRQTVIDVLAASSGHITGGARRTRRARDAGTTPSTVYRTLDVLEDLGLVRHAWRRRTEEFHVLPASRRGHLHCSSCGQTWRSTGDAGEAGSAVRAADGFEIDIGHVTLVGLCGAAPPRRAPERC